MIVRGELDRRQYQQLREALRALDLPPKKRQRLIWRIAKLGVIVAAKRHQRNQTDPFGNPWPARKRGKGKMLRQLPKLMHVREMPAIEAVRIYFKNGNRNDRVSAGLIAGVHQDGASFSMSADRAPRADQRNKSASPRQAKRLRSLGYKMRKNGKYVKASSAQILNTMSHSQAGFLIKKLKNKPRKTAWRIDIPSRVFLGVNDTEFNNILVRQLQAIGFG
ncbi:phage virion morphogenesis family protein [Yersinia pseudotuberculosis IP 32953]|uniref:Conserved hypothetical phage protein n=1 Tax=Yersinia pseudotuberculosis serotype I (strain IP32953) TaxID=273123 RepID=Q666V0_YERPS|nr:hypothetical protein [Yersinia pseudotuberculosis]AJJ55703.1 phage virion morphogenesis family protein [Yersinia pseudotuberculosis IP 32953]CAH22384.1 Conserved hypothetical phage protein [Yersinia pseudotuberculosis IP 32953]